MRSSDDAGPDAAPDERRRSHSLLKVVALAVVVALIAVVIGVVRDGRSGDRAETYASCARAGSPAAPGGIWCPTYSEDFDTPVAVGAFTNTSPDDWYVTPANPYSSALRSYPDGWPTTGDLSLNFASRTAEGRRAADGASGGVRLWARTELVDGRAQALGGSFFPVIRPGAEPVRAQTSQTYGRYSVRFKTVGGYAPTARGEYPTSPTEGRYGTAFLLWPADDHWPDGEVDFPEMGWGDRVQGHVHTIGQPEVNSADIVTAASSADWNTATIDWSPGLLVLSLNGVEVFRTSADVPSVPMRWGFQSGGTLATPAPGITGELLVDWVRIDAYVPDPGSP